MMKALFSKDLKQYKNTREKKYCSLQYICMRSQKLTKQVKTLYMVTKTCTRVAKSSWKKKINTSSLALSLCSMLASKCFSLPPPLDSHPASTLRLFCPVIYGCLRNRLRTPWFWIEVLSMPLRNRYRFVSLLERRVEWYSPLLPETVNVVVDIPCTIYTKSNF